MQRAAVLINRNKKEGSMPTRPTTFLATSQGAGCILEACHELGIGSSSVGTLVKLSRPDRLTPQQWISFVDALEALHGVADNFERLNSVLGDDEHDDA